MSALITFDDSLWPLVVTRVVGVMTDRQFEDFLARSTTFLQRGEKYVGITDGGQVGLLPAHQRHMLAEWILEHDAVLRERVLGNAIIVTSAPVRLAMSVVFHLQSLPIPYVAVADMDSALSFVIGKLEEGGFNSEAERIRQHVGLSGIRAD